MALLRYCIYTVVLLICMLNINGQTVYYPVGSSQLLKATAQDVAGLLQQAVAGSQFTVQEYSVMPSNGIVLCYNNINVEGNQHCKVKSNGQSNLIFTAPQDNGLVFGVYEYLNNLGFKFYLPGSIWQVVPNISSAYKNIDTVYTSNYKYKGWFISGGYRAWVMDRAVNYSWDTYGGENGYNWALYQRRNSMLGQYRFAGHRADIVKGDYLNTIKNNPCYIAEHNGQRVASSQSVPDINNKDAVSLWTNAIEKSFTTSLLPTTVVNQNTINTKRNLDYSQHLLGIEVPDGSQWGNSNQVQGCGATSTYPSEADQHFILANKTATVVNSKYPNKQFQLYAYSTHANVPSNNISINKNIDIQLIPTVYQLESSVKGLRNRWLNKTNNLSEYHYLNLSTWSGELPSFKWAELKQTLNTVKNKKMQGIMWEASPAKFASLPYLFTANNFLKNNIDVDKTLEVFCNDMFGAASKTMVEFFQIMGSEDQTPSKQKIQLYINLIEKACKQNTNESDVINARLLEVKAYLHYMCLYLNSSSLNSAKKIENEEGLCMYLAKISKMQLVNSYFLINSIVSKYNSTTPTAIKFNTASGTAYNSGNLPLITVAEIEANFKEDVNKYGNKVNSFSYPTDASIENSLLSSSLKANNNIGVKIKYTNGINYYSKAGYSIIASKPGSFIINYKARFDNSEKGYLNFVVEAVDENLSIIKDEVLGRKNTEGSITVNLPKAGRYTFTMVTKYQVEVDLAIETKGNLFYSKSMHNSSRIVTYQTEGNRYFFVPNQLSRLYFTVNNYSGGYAMENALSTSLKLQCVGNINISKPILVTPTDSSFFYIEIPVNARGKFWSVSNTSKYSIQLVNTTNNFWFAVPKPQDAEVDLTQPNVYPNPSSGFYKCMLNGKNVIADELIISNSQGLKMAVFQNVNSFNISHFAAGVYLFNMYSNRNWYTGKLVKL